ncbi:MAG: ABC transporter substrate-binding protein [Hyphomonadaceae bacterium]|jgi:4,5-dihydroxyphthalate decarboxylase|nr:ABC transporter substrate-binding protein [Hyphomonadaceae bacterium]
MSKLELSIAVGDYDRLRPLIDGTVAIDGVTPVFMTLDPEEIFFRAFQHAEFDIAELSLSSFIVRAARGDNPYVGIPVFPSRAFRHSGIYIRTDRSIRAPGDLKGRKVGLAEYQLTANVWIRAFLQDDFGVDPVSIRWVRGGVEEPGRIEKLPITLPPGVSLTEAPPGRSLSELLLAGEIDALIGPRTPSVMIAANPHIGWLFPDPRSAAIDNYRRTGNFPIMHLIGVRKTLAEQHAWLPAAVLKAFDKAKAVAVTKLTDTSASKVMLPFVDQQLQEARNLLGRDFWPYGLSPNRSCLDYFLQQHHKQGLSHRLVAAAELFHPATLDVARI